jgi:Ras-related protein Rab-27A
MESESAIKPRIIKYKVFGPKNSGRKSLVFRYSQNAFKKEEQPNFNIDFMFKMINKGGKKYNMKIFRPKADDEMGSKEYLKGIKMVIYIFDITNEESIKHFKDNAEKLFINADNNAFKYVFGNKIDLEDQRKIKTEQAKEICDNYIYMNIKK